MLTMVNVVNNRGDLLNLPLEDVSDGYVVQEIEGLDPVKATIVSSSFATLDGVQYHSSRREARTIKLRLGLEPDYVETSVQDLRQRLYKFFMPKTAVDMEFISSEDLVVNISGRVEAFETVLFTDEPAVDIAVMCFDPDFYDSDPIALTGSTTSSSTDTTIVYDGTVETGVALTLDVNRTMSEFTVYHRPPDGSLRTLDFSATLLAGDSLKITTIPGQKSVILKRYGAYSSALYGLSPQSAWMELLPGTNYFRVYATGAAIPYTLDYVNKYGGL